MWSASLYITYSYDWNISYVRIARIRIISNLSHGQLTRWRFLCPVQMLMFVMFCADAAVVIIMLLASLNSCVNPWIFLAFSGLETLEDCCRYVTTSGTTAKAVTDDIIMRPPTNVARPTAVTNGSRTSFGMQAMSHEDDDTTCWLGWVRWHIETDHDTCSDIKSTIRQNAIHRLGRTDAELNIALRLLYAVSAQLIPLNNELNWFCAN